MKIKGIIFDLDGTLLDSMGLWTQVDRNFLTENGIEPPDGISDIVKKMTIYDSAMYFKTRFSLKQSCEEIIDRIEEMVKNEYENTVLLKEGAMPLLKELGERGLKMCVATATYNSLAYASLKRLGVWDMLDFVLTCSDVGCGKDSPEIFIRSASKLGLEKNEIIVVEDSLHCVETAAGAGFKTIAVYDDASKNEWDQIRAAAWQSVTMLKEIYDILLKEEEPNNGKTHKEYAG